MQQSNLSPAWQQLIDQCQNCRQCGLGQSRTQAVVFRGAPVAPLMLIGEGPGAEEDARGEPFVGAAGRLLDLLLTAYGLDDTTFHIGNIVKCRPPDNRVPTEDEAKACRPLLARQFNLVKPKVIVLLGATAYKYFTGGTEGITKVRGQWIEKNGFLILPTYHPAYILRNNRERIRLWEDIGQARAQLETLGLLPPLVCQPDMPTTRR